MWASTIAVVVAVMALGPTNADAAVNPTLSGAVADSGTLPGVTAVAVSGQYAYVTGYYAGRLVAVDISDPAEPVIAGESEASNALTNATTVNIVGGYAYVVSKNRNGPSGSETNEDGMGNSLTILDIATDPASPTIVGSLHDTESLFGAYGVAISGSDAYVAAQGCLTGQPCPNHSVGNAFAVIDISDPASPTLVAALHNASLPSPWTGTGAFGHATAVAISGSYAYVTAAYQDRLTVVNIANPQSPEIVASLKDTTDLNDPVDVTVSGQYAYVVDQISPGRLTVVNVSNPAAPQVVTSLASASLNGAYRIRLRGSFAYVSAFSGADVAVLDISDPSNPRLVATVADGTHLNRTSGLDLDASGGFLVASSPFLSTQTQPLYPPFALQSGGPTLTGTVSVITLDPAPIAVSIAPESQPANPTAQTSAAFSFSVNDAVSVVECELDGGAWLPCTTPTTQSYGELGGGSHTFAVQATDSAGNTSTASYEWTVTAPANISPPSLSGSAAVGQTLNVAAGSWTGSPAPTLTYQWMRCDAVGVDCAPIAGATSSSYTAGMIDAGSTLAAQVTATNSAGSGTVETSPTAAVTESPASISSPTLSGSAAEGHALSTSGGSWSGYPAPSLTYQWERCNSQGQDCVPISGASTASYTALSSDVGSTLLVMVTATNSVGSGQASSLASAVVAGETLTAGVSSLASSVVVSESTPVVVGESTPPGVPYTAVALTDGQITALLSGQLAPAGKAAAIGALLRHDGLSVSIKAPEAGRLTLAWYELPPGAKIAKVKAKPVLIATGSASATTANTVVLTIKLTAAGKRLLKRSTRVRLTAISTFTPAGGTHVTVSEVLLLTTKSTPPEPASDRRKPV